MSHSQLVSLHKSRRRRRESVSLPNLAVPRSLFRAPRSSRREYIHTCDGLCMRLCVAFGMTSLVTSASPDPPLPPTPTRRCIGTGHTHTPEIQTLSYHTLLKMRKLFSHRLKESYIMTAASIPPRAKLGSSICRTFLSFMLAFTLIKVKAKPSSPRRCAHALYWSSRNCRGHLCAMHAALG